MNFWHGGNLDDYSEIISQKNGRYEYGAGLYLTTHHGTALKYAKGSRKLYLVTVKIGNEINKSNLNIDKVTDFVNTYVIGSLRKTFLNDIQKYVKDGMVRATVFNTMILNRKAVKSTNTKYVREFLMANDIDYEIVDNAFGWGEKMMVLYDTKSIVNTIRIKPTDKIQQYDLLKSE
jgi:hypothetical protein